MKIVFKKKNVIAVVAIIVVLILSAVAAYLYFNNNFLVGPVKKSDQTSQNEKKTDNVVDYNPPTEEQKTAQFEKPKDEKAEKTPVIPSKIIISNSGFAENGDYEISAYSAESKDSSAKCILSINGTKLTEVGVQIYPHMAMCKGFTIAKSDLKSGKNQFEIEFISDNYKDKTNGEF